MRLIKNKGNLVLILWAVAILGPAGWSRAASEAGSDTVVIPAGFGVERYARIWERNPFAPEEPAIPQTRPTVFDDLYLTSWLNDSGKEVVSVQNAQTNDLQTISAKPNENDFRLLGIHTNQNPQLVEAVIQHGREQGTVRFRFDLPAAAATNLRGPANNGSGGQGLNPVGTNAIAPANQSNAQAAPNLIYPGMVRVRTEGASRGQQGIHSRSKFPVAQPPKASAAPAQ